MDDKGNGEWRRERKRTKEGSVSYIKVIKQMSTKCIYVETTGYRQREASSASRDAAAPATTHMWPQCSGADFLHSGSILLIHQRNKQSCKIVKIQDELRSVKKKGRESRADRHI
ncbi:hypothetical protein ABVT39_004237 [Epinephelus coioides]